MDRSVPGVVRVTLAGEFDISNTDRLAELLQPAESADTVIVDMTRTTFVDLKALRCLVHLKKRLLANGGGVVRLVGVMPHIRKMLSLIAADRLFEFSERASVDGLAGAPSEHGAYRPLKLQREASGQSDSPLQN